MPRPNPSRIVGNWGNRRSQETATPAPQRELKEFIRSQVESSPEVTLGELTWAVNKWNLSAGRKKPRLGTQDVSERMVRQAAKGIKAFD